MYSNGLFLKRYFKMDKYIHKLSFGANNIIIVLSDAEVAKIYEGDIGSEVKKMKVANAINSLIVKFYE